MFNFANQPSEAPARGGVPSGGFRNNSRGAATSWRPSFIRPAVEQDGHASPSNGFTGFNRGGRFARGSTNKAPGNHSHIDRGVDEMFADDKYAADYDSVAIEDAAVEIVGLPRQLKSFNTWADLNLDQRVLKNVERAKYLRPRNIQCAAIPVVLQGYDLICHAETGSGKILSYLLPILDRGIDDKRISEYASKPFVPYAVILQPTRELCLQCFEQAVKFANGTGITVAKAYGGYSVQKNKEELSGTCDILIATPDRFKDFILSECRFLVFDESDQLLRDDFKKTIDHAILNSKIYPKRQTLFFSATFNYYARMNAKSYMHGGQRVVEVKNKACEQVFKVVQQRGKFGVVLNCLRAEFGKVEKDAVPRTIIFCHSTRYCEKLAIGLELSGIPALPLFGSIGQGLREEFLKKFRDGEVKVLCVIDVGSLGLDVKDVDLVVQFDMASRYDIYVNRVGRTGRIRHGKCISFVDLEKDHQVLYQIKKAMEEAGQDIPQSLHDAVADAPTQQAPELHVALFSTQKAPPNVPKLQDNGSVPAMPLGFQPPVFDYNDGCNDGWD